MKAPSLCLHCGANEVPRSLLSEVRLPEVTKTYTPIGHDTFINIVQDKLQDVGFRFGVEAHSLTKGGDRYFGLVQLLNGTESEQHALVVGVRNSIDKSFPAAIAFGSQVFVCDNLAFTGEVKVSRKHTTHIMRDLPGLVASAVSQTALMRDNQNSRFEFYQNSPLRTRAADHVIVEMLRRGVINTQRVEKVVAEWDEPSHDFGGRTAWRLFNAATEVLKTTALNQRPGRTIVLQAILDSVTGFVPKVAQPIEGDFTRLA